MRPDPTALAADSTRRAVVSPRAAMKSLRLAREELRRLRRRQRVLTFSSGVGLAVLAVRGVVAVLAPPSSSWQLIVGTAVAVGFAACVSGLVVAHRWGRRVEDLRADIFTLEFLDGALTHETRPLVLNHPYRTKQDEEGPPVIVLRRPRVLRAEALRVEKATAPSARWRGAAIASFAAAAAILVGVAVLVLGGVAPERHRWTFTEQGATVADLGLVIPVERAGAWHLEDHEHATGGRALVNYAGHPEGSPALAVANRLRARDLRATTRCQVTAAPRGNACGLVFRFHDPANHYVAQLDASAGHVALMVVARGTERTIQQHPADIPSGIWHELVVEAHADSIVVSWNGRKVIDAHDLTLSNPGAVGLWVPSSGVAVFDELSVEALAATPHPVELLPFLLKKRS